MARFTSWVREWSRKLVLAGLASCGLASGAVAGQSLWFSNSSAAAVSAPTPESTLVAGTRISTEVGAGRAAFAARRTPNGWALRAAGMSAGLTRSAVTVRSATQALRFTTVALGRGSHLGRPVAELGMWARANRVTESFDGLKEWFAAGPLGLEQGFTVPRRVSGSGRLTIALGVKTSLRPSRVTGGVEFVTHEGDAAFRYAGLAVVDARGRSLPASLLIGSRGLQVKVDDAGAVYPITVDPVIQAASTLTPSDETGDAGFGESVAVSANGQVAIIGGGFDNSGVGAAWVYTRSGSTWTETAKLTAPTTGLNAEDPNGNAATGGGGFGWTVALSADGTEALIGSYADDNYAGAAWIYTYANSTWSVQTKLVPSGSPDAAGYSLALSPDGGTALLGTPFQSSEAGEAWVFTGSGSSWTQAQTLTAPTTGNDAASGSSSEFGASAALVGSSGGSQTALIGGPGDDSGLGAAWVFSGDAGAMTAQAKLVPPTSGPDAAVGSDPLFGVAVGLSSDGTVAMASGSFDNSQLGAAWIFNNSGSAWSETAKLTAPTSGTAAEAASSELGYDAVLSANGETALLVASDDGTDAGDAWTFNDSGSGWSETAKLAGTPSGDELTNGATSYSSGAALSSDGTTALYGTGDNKDSGEVSAAQFGVSFNDAFVTFDNLSQPGPDGTETAPVVITNSGDVPLQIGTLSISGVAASAFTIASDSCSGQTLAAGTTCDVSIKFAPGSPAANPDYRAALEVPDDAAGTPQSLSLLGVVPAASFSATALSFGSASAPIAVGATSGQTLTIDASSLSTLTLGSLTISGPQASAFSLTADKCSNAILFSTTSCTVTVLFNPGAAGSYSAQLNVADDAYGSPQAIALTGQSNGTVSATASPTSLDFTSGQAQTVTVTNTSTTADLDISGTSFDGGDASSFRAISSCPPALGPGQQCGFSISFVGGPGSYSARLLIATNVPGNSLTTYLPVSLTATGGTNSIIGHVYLDSAHAPASDYHVEACAKAVAGSCVVTSTGVDGSYAFPNLPYGTWQVNAQYDGDAEAAVVVGPGAPSVQDLLIQTPVPLSGGLSIDGESSGVAAIYQSQPVTLGFPFKIAPTGTPNTTDMMIGFGAIEQGLQSSDPANIDFSAAMIVDAVRYGPDGKVSGVASPFLAPVNCGQSSAQHQACLGLSGLAAPSGSAASVRPARASAHDGVPTTPVTPPTTSTGETTIGGSCRQIISNADASATNTTSPIDSTRGTITLASNGYGGVNISYTDTNGDKQTFVLSQAQIPTDPSYSPWANTGISLANAVIGVTPAGWYDAFLAGANATATTIESGVSVNTLDGAWAVATQFGSTIFESTPEGALAGVSYNLITGIVTPSNVKTLVSPTTVTVTNSVSTCATTYVDPSGNVRTTTGIPLKNATVTLRRTGTQNGNPIAVANGSLIMSAANRHNPDHTDALGAYGWDVLPGFYDITARHRGCTAADHRAVAVSRLLPVPPAQTGVNLTLRCPHLHRAAVKLLVAVGARKSRYAPYDLRAEASAPRHGSRPQGTVTFYSGHAKLAGVALDVKTGQAFLPVGASMRLRGTITARYSGDADYKPAVARSKR